MTDQKYKLVPVEPTAEMTAAALDVLPPPLHRLKTVNVDAAIRHAIAAAPNPFGLHPSTAHLASKFSEALAEKLAAAEAKYGYSDDWNRSGWMDECRQHLREHLAKGDPRDVAAYCAFLWHHGESTATPEPVCKWTFVGIGFDSECGWHVEPSHSEYPHDSPYPFCPHCGRKTEVMEYE